MMRSALTEGAYLQDGVLSVSFGAKVSSGLPFAGVPAGTVPCGSSTISGLLRLGPGEGLDAIPVRSSVGGREQGGEAINRLLVEGAVDTRMALVHNQVLPNRSHLGGAVRPWSIRIVTVARAVEATSGRRRLRLAPRCQCGPGVVPRRERSLRRPCERRGISGLETPVSPGFRYFVGGAVRERGGYRTRPSLVAPDVAPDLSTCPRGGGSGKDSNLQPDGYEPEGHFRTASMA